MFTPNNSQRGSALPEYATHVAVIGLVVITALIGVAVAWDRGTCPARVRLAGSAGDGSNGQTGWINGKCVLAPNLLGGE